MQLEKAIQKMNLIPENWAPNLVTAILKSLVQLAGKETVEGSTYDLMLLIWFSDYRLTVLFSFSYSYINSAVFNPIYRLLYKLFAEELRYIEDPPVFRAEPAVIQPLNNHNVSQATAAAPAYKIFNSEEYIIHFDNTRFTAVHFVRILRNSLMIFFSQSLKPSILQHISPEKESKKSTASGDLFWLYNTCLIDCLFS